MNEGVLMPKKVDKKTSDAFEQSTKSMNNSSNINKNPWLMGKFDNYDFAEDIKKMGFNAGYEKSIGHEGKQY